MRAFFCIISYFQLKTAKFLVFLFYFTKIFSYPLWFLLGLIIIWFLFKFLGECVYFRKELAPTSNKTHGELLAGTHFISICFNENVRRGLELISVWAQSYCEPFFAFVIFGFLRFVRAYYFLFPYFFRFIFQIFIIIFVFMLLFYYNFIDYIYLCKFIIWLYFFCFFIISKSII